MHRFEFILRSPGAARDPWDQKVDESSSFVAFPSLGALVPGWLLAVPRRSQLNLRALMPCEQAELNALINRLRERLSAFAGDVYCFEHGNATPGGPVGCGVDQAHLHLVPLTFDLLDAALRTEDASILWTEHEDVDSFPSLLPAEGEYLAIWDTAHRRGLVGGMSVPQSQWIRRLIAAQTGREEAWDYKTHPNVQNLLQTVDTLHRTRPMKCLARQQN